MKKFGWVFLIFLSALQVTGQKGVTTFGLQYKPVIPNRFIGTYEQSFNEAQLVSSIKQMWGHSFGGVIRQGITKNISFETGINLTRRNYNLDFAVPDSGYHEVGRVRVVSYEIPISCLIYIQLSKSLFINTSLGTAITLFPSSVRVQLPITGSELFKQEGAYKHKVQGALLANVGFEYRTRESGYFYFGTSYHLPFVPIMTFAMAYEHNTTVKALSIGDVRGSYLTVDLRYFFNERPEKKVK